MEEHFNINLGLFAYDENWFLCKYLGKHNLQHLPIEPPQLDCLVQTNPELLDWNHISRDYLPGWFFVKYQDQINWEIFIKNGKRKNVLKLKEVEHQLLKHANLFFLNDQIKNAYYTGLFIILMPSLVDWQYAVQHKTLNDLIISKYFNKIPTHDLCKYQLLSEKIIDQYKNQLDWNELSKHIDLSLIEKFDNFINFAELVKYQPLSVKLILKYKSILDSELVSRYQSLSEEFILENHKWLHMRIVSQYQNLSFEFICAHHNILFPDLLEKNKNYNHTTGIQIFKRGAHMYFIDQPHDATQNIYCNVILHHNNRPRTEYEK